MRRLQFRANTLLQCFASSGEQIVRRVCLGHFLEAATRLNCHRRDRQLIPLDKIGSCSNSDHISAYFCQIHFNSKRSLHSRLPIDWGDSRNRHNFAFNFLRRRRRFNVNSSWLTQIVESPRRSLLLNRAHESGCDCCARSGSSQLSLLVWSPKLF